jgi:hypothetical protein
VAVGRITEQVSLFATRFGVAQVGFADPTKRVGFGYVTNALQVADDTRAPSIIRALRDVIG